MTESMPLSCLPKGKRNWSTYQTISFLSLAKGLLRRVTSGTFPVSTIYSPDMLWAESALGRVTDACDRKLLAFSETVILKGCGRAPVAFATQIFTPKLQPICGKLRLHRIIRGVYKHWIYHSFLRIRVRTLVWKTQHLTYIKEIYIYT